MELDPKDYDVAKLLSKLKNNNASYPPELLTPRRQAYIRRVAEIGLGVGVSAGLKTTVKSGSRSRALSATTTGLVEAVLIVAIVVEAGAAAYIYRDEISALIQSYTAPPRVEVVTTVPETEFAPNLPEVVLTEPPEESPTPLTSETPSGTPVAPTAAANDNNDTDPNNTGVQSVSTPDPNENSGNQYGLTPKPDRTKEPGGGGNIDNNDKGKDK